MDFQPVLAALLAHQWLLGAALFVGLLVRISKSDMIGPNIPARARPYLALALGLASGVLDAAMNHKPLTQALIEGLLAGGGAILGHNVVIEGLRGGKEIGVPGLMRGAAPKPPSVPPVATGVLFVLGLSTWLTFTPMTACKNAQTANDVVSAALSLEQIACVVMQADLGANDPAFVQAVCKIDPALLQQVVQQMEGQKRGKALAAAKRAAPPSDAGAYDGAILPALVTAQAKTSDAGTAEAGAGK